MTATHNADAKGVLFWSLPDNGRIRVGWGKEGQFRNFWQNTLLLPNAANADLLERAVQYWHPSPPTVAVPEANWVVNYVAEPDIAANGQAWLEKRWGGKVPIFNHPNAIRASARDRIEEVFGGIKGLVVPKTVRLRLRSVDDLKRVFDDNGFRFPVILRPAKWQTGMGMLRIDSHDDWVRIIGSPYMTEDQFMIQFEDVGNAAGEYQKVRVLFVGGTPYLRHVKATTDWMIHNTSKNAVEGFAGKREIQVIDELEANPTFMHICSEIGQRLQLDFFGADIGIDPANNRFVLFEANPSMSVFFAPREDDTPERAERRERLQLRAERAVVELLKDPTRWRSG